MRVVRKPWWRRDDESYAYGGYDQSAKKRKKAAKKASPASVLAADDDPEGIPSLGMGNLPYIPPRLMLVADPGFGKLTPATADAAPILAQLSSTRTDIRAVAEERQAILDAYKEGGFKPLWLDGGKVSPRANELLAYFSEAGDEGLNAQTYLPPVLTSFDNVESQLGSDPEKLARFDIGLTAAALSYASHASGGQFDPRRLSLYHDLESRRVSPAVAIKVLGWSPFAVQYLASLHPKHEAYSALKQALADSAVPELRLPAIQIPDGRKIRPGKRDSRMELVRVRLQTLDLLTPADALVAPEDADLLDPALSDALKKFQRAAKIKVSGALDSTTVTALNKGSIVSDSERIVMSMERLRWMPRNFGARHVLVNQAAYEVRVIDGPREVWRSRVIVGKPMTQTNVFSDQMETVVFNPSWGVPPSIIANEYLPKLRRDPGYLDRIGFKVVNEKGKVVSSRSVNWSAYGNTPPFGIQQPPGGENALGELKFLFPNSHNIYMHDTPAKHLFDKDGRAFSHGCVRVQNPREFAAVLLGWDAEMVNAETDSRKSKTVKLSAKVPVHIAYFTAWPDSDGKIRYFDDIYGRDETLRKALAGQRGNARPEANGRLVQN
ncbi:MAG: L,D-transpeptidase family protein [Rhizobiales bacterium]|nr:L,D-transpeptidase family protein [Hyphomicrobiales bacterium]